MNPAERAARERKQKIFVAVGGIVLVLLLAIQLPKLLGGSGSTASDTTGTDTVSTDPGTPATPTTPTAPTTVAVALTDTDQPLPADPSKLRSLRSFSGKDPFVQQVKAPAADAGASSETGGGGEGAKSGESDSTGFSVGEQSESVTVISVNGARQALSPGSLFPAANPVFVLVGEQPKAKTVTIGVAGGAYESGAKATKLKVGKPLVLVNTTTDAKYRLVLVAVGDGSAPEPTKATSKQKKGTETP